MKNIKNNKLILASLLVRFKPMQAQVFTVLLAVASLWVLILNDLKIIESSVLKRETDNSYFLEGLLIAAMFFNLTYNFFKLNFSGWSWLIIVLSFFGSLGFLFCENENSVYMFLHIVLTLILIFCQFLILKNEKKILLLLLIPLFIGGCKKEETVEPTYFAQAEFKGFQGDKAQMHIVGTITGSPHASAASGETLSCSVPEDLKSSMLVIDSKWQITFRYYKRAIGKDKYEQAKVIKKL